MSPVHYEKLSAVLVDSVETEIPLPVLRGEVKFSKMQDAVKANTKTIEKPGEGIQTKLERSLIVRWVVGSILHSGPTEPYLVPASARKVMWDA